MNAQALVKGSAVLLAVVLTAAPAVSRGQQGDARSQAQTVDLGSCRFRTPAGGGWKVTVEKGKGHVLVEKKQTGLIRSLTGLSQDATIDVYEVRTPLETWRLGESQIVARLNAEYQEVQGQLGELVGVQDSQATLKDKTFHVLSFTIRSYDPGIPPWSYVHYLYVPPQFKRTHVLYNFVYAHGQAAMAGMLNKMKTEPLLEVIDSLELVDPLASVGGDPGELLRAAAAGDNDKIAGLLEKGVDVNTAATPGTALCLAALFGHGPTVDLLLDRGVDINKTAPDAGAGPLSCAIMAGEPEIAGHLVDKGAAVDVKTREGLTPLIFAIAMGPEELALRLVDKGSDVRQMTADGTTPLHLSATTGQAQVAARLIDAGADVNAQTLGGGTMNAQTAPGWTPLMAAVQEKHRDVASLLMDKGADVNKKTPEGWTALFCAADAGDLETAQALVGKGADINARVNETRRTPLIESIIADHPEVAGFLIGKGADVNAKSKEGYTALKIAKAKKLDDLVGLLRKAGAR